VFFIARKNSLLRLHAALRDAFGRVPVWQFHLVPSNLQVSVLRSPTEQTLLGAVEKRWRHLNALVASYAVKLLFIARSIID
jgi:hypothetical protein